MGAKKAALWSDARDLVRAYGIAPSGVVYRNLDVDALYQFSVQRGQAIVMTNGALLQDSTPNVGRAAKSSFYVNDPALRFEGKGKAWSLEDLMAWGSPAEGRFDNLPIGADVYDRLKARVIAQLSSCGDVFVNDGWSGRTDASRLAVRVITEEAPAALFSKNIFLRATEDELVGFPKGWTILHAPSVHADPADGTNGGTFIITHLGEQTTIIGGTRYFGQIKKAIFAVQNFRLPLKGILTMHAGSSEGKTGASAIHAVLSGTGKTTLSNTGNPVADDQIVLEIDRTDDRCISNMEGGQYAKTDQLRADKEPETWYAIGYGTVSENVWVNEKGEPDYDNTSITANGRVGYPLEFVDTGKPSGCAKAPGNITFLTADGFGVLPPVSLLTVEGGMFHFAAGFTSKMPGTEKGVVEPKPTFSAFFGKPFMPLKPAWYMDLLAKLVSLHGTRIWLVNTGWLGPNVPGRGRVDILASKAIINAVRDDRISLDDANFWYDPVFKLRVPKEVPGVDAHLLDPRNFWSDPEAYAAASNQLAEIFQQNMGKLPHMPPEVLAAGPSPVARAR